jgi:hypothetical protein
MDKDQSGEISFSEFVKATLGSSDSKGFSSYADERDADEIGPDLYVLLSRYQRKKIMQNIADFNRKDDVMSRLVCMHTLFCFSNISFAI